MKIRQLKSFAVVSVLVAMALPGIAFASRSDRAHAEDTKYASKYSDKRFESIQIGDSEEKVHSVVGAPLYEVWRYSQEPYEFSVSGFETYKFKKNGMRVAGVCAPGPDRDACYAWKKEQPLVHSFDEAVARYGQPSKKLWVYSVSPTDKSYDKRALRIQNGLVDKIISEIYHADDGHEHSHKH